MTVSDICKTITPECDEWLKSIGYYDKPASLKHHGCDDGDLFRHSHEVAMQLVKLTIGMHLEWKRPESPILVGLLHDVCKCDDYIGQKGLWRYNNNRNEGHGEKSVMMLSDHIELTDEEKACIHYHMGAFTDREEWRFYSNAVHDYPNVLYTHTADMIASQILEI